MDAPSGVAEARRTPLLLASVADPGEAAMALRAGAAIIDLKDPRRGALGPCRLGTLRAARALVLRLDPTRPMSAAAGPARSRDAIRVAAGAARLGYRFVKCGLEDLSTPARAVAALRRVGRAARAASPGVRLIAATYADAGTVRALPWTHLPEVAARAGFDGCLLDTATKDGRRLTDVLTDRDLADFAAGCRAAGLMCALAGSLDLESLARTPALLGADFIGARGALCSGGRRGRLDARRVRRFARALRRTARVVAPRVRAVPGRAPAATPPPAPPTLKAGAGRTADRARRAAADPRTPFRRRRSDRVPGPA